MAAVSNPDALDIVDRIQQEWASSYPDLDVRPVGVLGRISRIAAVTSQQLDRNLERHGITRSEFDVLAALARSAEPVRASGVVSTTMLSGASVTKLADSLSRRGLIERRKSERDGRVVLLVLTEQGRRLIDDEFPRRLDDDERVLAGLSGTERDELVALLRKISVALRE